MDKIVGFTKDGMPVRVHGVSLQLDQGTGIGGIATIAAVIGVIAFVAIKGSKKASYMSRNSRR